MSLNLPLISVTLDEEDDNAPPGCKLIGGFLTLISIFPNGIPLPDITALFDNWAFEFEPSSCAFLSIPLISFNALDELKFRLDGDLNAGDSISCEWEARFSLGDDEDKGFDEFMAKFPTDIEFVIRSLLSKRLS